jgi:glutamine synthetase adenylyltransferase
VEKTIRGIVHERARSIAPKELSDAVVDVRNRLEKQRAGRLKAGAIDIKYGVGGLLDIYFASRYLQLRDAVQDSGDRRSTQTTLQNLRDAGSISAADHTAFSEGHKLLSKVDHSIRLSVGRSTQIPFANDPAMRNICSEAKCASVVEFAELVLTHLSRIREAFVRILQVDQIRQ